jgi:hypothetical protein
MKLCEADLRCLDAHAHLGNFVFDHRPKEAIRHYEAGVRIWAPPSTACCPGAASTTVRSSAACAGSACVSGGSVDSRRRRASSTGCWLNPSDNQGVRVLVEEVRSRKPWQDRPDEQRR